MIWHPQIEPQERDIRHTAEDVEDKEVGEFFDIELHAGAADSAATISGPNGEAHAATKAGESNGYVNTDGNLSTHM